MLLVCKFLCITLLLWFSITFRPCRMKFLKNALFRKNRTTCLVLQPPIGFWRKASDDQLGLEQNRAKNRTGSTVKYAIEFAHETIQLHIMFIEIDIDRRNNNAMGKDQTWHDGENAFKESHLIQHLIEIALEKGTPAIRLNCSAYKTKCWRLASMANLSMLWCLSFQHESNRVFVHD